MASSFKNFLRVIRGERVDQPDMDHAVSRSIADAVNQIGDGFLVGDDSTSKMYVVEGFAVTADGGGTVTVAGGKAILGWRDRGQVKYGALLTGGETTQSRSIASFSDGTYGVYIRFKMQETEVKTRRLWNPLASPDPVEFAKPIATRLSENWDIAITKASPGAEWHKLADIVKPGFTVTDLRQFYFEGSDADSYQVTDAEWGAASDRDAARDTEGVFGLRRFARAVQRQLQDIIGSDSSSNTGWWIDAVGGTLGGSGARSLAALNSAKLDRNGNQTIGGHIAPGVDTTYDWGGSGARFRNIYGNNGIIDLITLGSNYLTTQAAAHLPRWSALMAAGAVANRTLIGASELNGGALTSTLYVYRANIGSTVGGVTWVYTYEHVFNAIYNDTTDQWTQINTAAPSIKIVFSNKGIRVFSKNSGTGGAWSDDAWSATLMNLDEAIGMELTALNVSGNVVVGGNIAAVGNVGGENGSFSGSLLADYFEPTQGTPTVPAANRLYEQNVPKAWGRIKMNGSGGIDPTGSVVFNVDDANWATAHSAPGGNSQITITFDTSMVDANSYSVTFGDANNLASTTVLAWKVISKSAGSFIVRAMNVATGTFVSLDDALIFFDFHVHGVQA